MIILGRINAKANPARRWAVQSSTHPNAGLRMAPMIDMIFLLLIFFLVAAKWRPKEDFLPLQFATAGVTMPLARPELLLIRISQNASGCRVQIGQSYVADILADDPAPGLADMMTEISRCLLQQKRYVSDPVEIVCAADVKWEYLARIYNVLVGMGLTDITFRMTDQTPESPAHSE